MANGEDLGLGLGKLKTLPKPNKPIGPVKNVRPIVLLPLLRKLLSLIILERIRLPVDFFCHQLTVDLDQEDRVLMWFGRIDG